MKKNILDRELTDEELKIFDASIKLFGKISDIPLSELQNMMKTRDFVLSAEIKKIAKKVFSLGEEYGDPHHVIRLTVIELLDPVPKKMKIEFLIEVIITIANMWDDEQTEIGMEKLKKMLNKK